MLASESPCHRLSASLKGTLQRGQKRFHLELFKKRANKPLLQSPGKDATLIISQLSFIGRPFPCQSPTNISICFQSRIPQLPVLGLLQPGTSLGKGCMCDRSADKSHKHFPFLCANARFLGFF